MATIHAFGPFRLDAEAEILFRGAEPLPVGKRGVALLRVLVERSGAPVSKDNLIEAAWSGLAVDDSNLAVQIAALRKVLSQEPGGDKWIETLPRRGYRFVGSVASSNSPLDAHALVQAERSDVPETRPQLAIPEKPSIAVLPFANMSGDKQQEYFSDGITEDIITELSRFSDLFVIARNSSFQYKTRSPDIRQVGRELGVRYVLEGSIRQSGARVRITAQLIDALTGAHRWAERYDRNLEDVFTAQDEVTRTIVTILVAHVKEAEVERTLLKPPSAWHAHDYFLRGSATFKSFYSTFKVRDLYEARQLFEQSLAIDAHYARALAALANTYGDAWMLPLDADYRQPVTLNRGYELAMKAVQIAPNLPEARSYLGVILTWKGQHEAALAEIEKAMSLNPNFTDWRFALVLVFGGDALRAIQVLNEHMRLDPFYPPLTPGWKGRAHYVLRQYQRALPFLRECVTRAPELMTGHIWLAATYAQLGQVEKARFEAEEVVRIHPEASITELMQSMPFRRPEDADHLFEGLRQASLPE